MIIDCDGCQMRDLACDDCVVTFMLGPPAGLGPAEQTALAVLAEGGLVPPLRMAPRSSAGQEPPGRAAVSAGDSPPTRGAASA